MDIKLLFTTKLTKDLLHFHSWLPIIKPTLSLILKINIFDKYNLILKYVNLWNGKV